MTDHWYVQMGLVTSPIAIALFIDEESFRKGLKKVGYKGWKDESFLPSAQANACVHSFYGDDGKEMNIVTIDYEKCLKQDKQQVYSILVHEAVHIWQHIKEHIGEKEPSKEFEAHSIQRIAQNLFYLYDDLIAKK